MTCLLRLVDYVSSAVQVSQYSLLPEYSIDPSSAYSQVIDSQRRVGTFEGDLRDELQISLSLECGKDSGSDGSWLVVHTIASANDCLTVASTAKAGIKVSWPFSSDWLGISDLCASRGEE